MATQKLILTIDDFDDLSHYTEEQVGTIIMSTMEILFCGSSSLYESIPTHRMDATIERLATKAV